MAQPDEALELLGGAAVVTITPPLGFPLAGLFHARVSNAVESDLTARALVLRSGDTQVALVACDLIGLPPDLIDRARTRAAERAGIDPGCVMISATHTHSGPYTTTRIAASRDEDYIDWVADRIAESVTVATSRLTPATVAVGSSTVDGVCYNRRYHMTDGTVRTNPGQGNPDALGPAAPVDPTVTALLVEDLDGRPIALWSNLSLHYVGTDSPEAISADYYGYFAQQVSQWLGPDVVGMMTNAASGDIINRDLAPQVPIRGTRRAKMVATTVAAAAISATMMARRQHSIELAVSQIPFSVNRYQVTEDDVALAQRIIDTPEGTEAPSPEFSFVVGSPLYPVATEVYARGVLALKDMPASQERELMLVRIAELALVGMPGEIFVELGLELRHRSPFPLTTVIGLCGGSVGYIPTRRAFSEGGYETWRHGNSWSDHGTGEAMVEAASQGLLELAGARDGHAETSGTAKGPDDA